VKDVTVATSSSAIGNQPVSGPPLPDSAISIQITYLLIETQAVMKTQVQVS
jgi:hypothetical protein